MPAVIDGELIQIGIVVHDLEKSMRAHGQLLGVERFVRFDTEYDARFRGQDVHLRNRNAHAPLTPDTDMFIELVEPGSGHGVQMDWLRTRGEGMFHLAYAVDDPDQRWPGAGIAFEVPGKGVRFLDTVDDLGYYVELIPRELANYALARIAAEAK